MLFWLICPPHAPMGECVADFFVYCNLGVITNRVFNFMFYSVCTQNKNIKLNTL